VLRRLKELGHVVRFVHDEVSYCLDRAKIWPIPKLWPICKIKLTPACLLCTMCHTYINRNSDKNPAILKKYYSLYNERRKLLKYLCEIDMIFAPSGYIRDTLQQNGLPPDKIKVVNLPGFDDTSAYSDSTGTSSESYILFAGRLVYLKGCQYLIRAMTKINENCKLIICGNGTYEHKLKEIAIHNNLQNRITFINWLSKGEINKYFANAKLIVVPSIWPEPGGTVGIEALSFGKPIVAFNVGGNSEWLKDGYNGFMVPRRNESLLADAINKILGNPQIAQRFGANSKTLYTRKFTLESFIAQIEYNLRNISTG
jgi:glycosyltransferase involved in cell wall biosynthesis